MSKALEAAAGRLGATAVYVAKPNTEQSNDELYAEALKVWSGDAYAALSTVPGVKG